MTRTKRANRTLSLLLSLCMVFTLLAGTAIAAGDIGPAEKRALPLETELADGNPETGTDHIVDSGATEMPCAAQVTDGGTSYTVEFTYHSLEYVLTGDSSAALSEILSTLGLTGRVEAVEISDERRFRASDESGEWVVTARQAFDTTEWMKVTINGVVHEITVTDEQTISGTITESTTWPDGSTIKGTVTISGGTEANPVVISIPGTVNVSGSGEEGEIIIQAGAHVLFQGSGTETSRLLLEEGKSLMPFISYYHPNEAAGATIHISRMTIDCNQQLGTLSFIGNQANPIEVDLSETVIQNTKHSNVFISLGACQTHLRRGTKLIGNQCSMLLQQGPTSDPAQFINTIYMYEGSEIANNTCSTRLIDVGLYSKFVMYAGTIEGNTVTANDALIPIFDGSAEIFGGSIQNNTSQAYILENYCGTLNIYGGTFSGNTGSNGGVLLNASYVGATSSRLGTTNIYGGTFTGNTGRSGGGAIWNNKYSILNLYGGTFSDNTSGANGGAIYSSGVLNIAPSETAYTQNGESKTSSGTLSVTGNTATYTGGGIAMGTTGALTLGGANIHISGNSSGGDKGTDLAILAGHPAFVTSALPGSAVTFSLLDGPGAGGSYSAGTAFEHGENVTLAENILQLSQNGFRFDPATGIVSKSACAVAIVDDIEHGTVTADMDSAAEGETITLTVTPESGYELDTLTVMQGETEVTTAIGENGTYTFPMPASDVTVAATFRALPAWQVTVENRVGTLSPAAVSLSSGPCAGMQSFTVTCTNACVLFFLEEGSESYVKLLPEPVEDQPGTYRFTLDVQSDLTLYVCLKGDVDGNGKLTSNDSSLINRHIVKTAAHKALTDEQLQIADVDGNGKITSNDSSLINRSIVKTAAHKALVW